MDKIKAFFKFKERKATLSLELIGGLITFLAMIYILPVNADILSSTGMKFGAVFAATALSAAIATLLMGLFANYPVALASGMGVNAFFAYTAVGLLSGSWEQALAAVLISGVLFVIISATGLRRLVINAIPKDLKLAVGAGIGFFIAFIGLKNAGIVVPDPATYITLGNLANPTVLLGLFGIVLVFVLYAINKKVSRFAVIISIGATALVGLLLGVIFPDSLGGAMPAFNSGGLGSIGDIKETFGKCFEAIPDLLANPMAYAIIFTFLFIDFFDTAGTLVAVGHDAGLLDGKGQLVGDDKAMMADAVGTVAGAVLGTSTVTSFIESTAGIQSGARTGLSSVVVGLLFLLTLFAYPIFSITGSIPVDGAFLSPVTSMALVFVGAMMVKSLKDIDWKDPIVVIASFIIVIMMFSTASIAEGIAFGFVFYVLMMLFTSRRKEVSITMYVLTALFVLNFIIKFVVL